MDVGSSNEAGSEEPTKFIVTRYSKEFSAAKPNIHLTEMAWKSDDKSPGTLLRIRRSLGKPSPKQSSIKLLKALFV